MSESEDADKFLKTTEPILGLGEGRAAKDITVATGEEEETNQNMLEFVPRHYQIEMYEESLKRNIIVAMDTGSGKTHIAIMRIQAALDSCPSNNTVWFMAPNLELCTQQYDVLQKHLPAVQIKFLSGNDNVDKWTSPSLWGAVLQFTQVIVCTHRILLDALSHGFVSLRNVALLVFDEAHVCIGDHPGAQIMAHFYEPDVAQQLPVPCVLGLSASPVMNSKPDSLEKIEKTLHAICRTPNKHRAELLLQVRIPELCQVLYDANSTTFTRSLTSLANVYNKANIYEDPYIISLSKDSSKQAKLKLEDAVQKRKTWCFLQMKSIYQTATVILQELGPWSVDCYISKIIARAQFSGWSKTAFEFGRLTQAERIHLKNILLKVEVEVPSSENNSELPLVSNKVREFINALPRGGRFVGIVFVKQRATVALLAHLLSIHPDTRNSVRVGTVVGTSSNFKRSANIADCIELEHQKDTLERFRTGKLDLLIATSVLEEGIDVPACNIVVCFDEDMNLKSFVQRRGRARQRDSKLVLMMGSQSNKLKEWQNLEMQMKAIYEDKTRELINATKKEEADSHIKRSFRIEKTKALLNLDNAIAHLHHFCSVLPANRYIDRRPEFMIIPGQPVRVILPKSVDESVRESRGQLTNWTSEKVAKKDAAFESYVALYKAGLVNDHLMPLLRHEETTNTEFDVKIEKRPSMATTSPQLNPWIEISQIWAHGINNDTINETLLTVTDSRDEVLFKITMCLPLCMPNVPPIRLYWDTNIEIMVTLQPLKGKTSGTEFETAQQYTWAILNSAFGHRFPVQKPGRFVATFHSAMTLDGTELFSGGRQPLTNPSLVLNKGISLGLIRYGGGVYCFEKWVPRKPSEYSIKVPYGGELEISEEVPHLVVSAFSRRTDFLHPISSNNTPSTKRYAVPMLACTIDDALPQHMKAALLIPSIMHRLEVYFIADKLSKTILADVGFQNLSLVVTAISTSVAREETNYQRLEFLGDSLLKICTSVQLLAKYPQWHEGYLSEKKGRIVSNGRLAKAAQLTGLSKFILTKPFTGRKWRPMYVENLVNSLAEPQREMSTKVLADVVEALIGAAMVDGGMPKALACMKVFLPEIDWEPLEVRRAAIYNRALESAVQTNELILKSLMALIGYSFTKTSILLEAITHASCAAGSASLERLEFLGDCVLDHLIVRAIYSVEPSLSHFKMHLLRTALVNADYLAFVCMEWSYEQEYVEIVEDRTSHHFQISRSIRSTPLWKFMRHTSTALSNTQFETAERHESLRDEINDTIKNGSHYPWAMLSKLTAEKFFSDLVESLLGAIFIDSGSFESCDHALETMGILRYLRRIISDGVHILHPKEELGQLADTKKVKYEVALNRSIVESEEKSEYSCQISVGDEFIVEVKNGVSKEEVQTKAAEAAVLLLKTRQEAQNVAGVRRDTTNKVVDNIKPW